MESSCSTDRIQLIEEVLRIRKAFFLPAINGPGTGGPLRQTGIGGVRLFCIQIICNLPRGTEHYYETL